MSLSLRLAIMLNFNNSKVAYWPLAMKRRLRSISESVLSKTSDIPTVSIMCNLPLWLNTYIFSGSEKSFGHAGATVIYSYFEKGCRKKICTRQSRKVIWDMINTLFLTTVAVEPTLAAFLWHWQT